MNKFIREHIISCMINAGFDGDPSYYSKNEDVQKQIKFLRSILFEIDSYPAGLNEFIKYIDFVIPNRLMTFGVEKKNYTNQFIAFASLVNSLFDEKQRPSSLKGIPFAKILRKCKPILNNACSLAIAQSYLNSNTDKDEINFTNFVYHNPNLKDSVKEQCLTNKSISFLIYMHRYNYIKAHMINRYDEIIEETNLMALIAWEDEENSVYKINIYWNDFKRLLSAIVKHAKNNSSLEIFKVRLQYALDNVVKSIVMKELLTKTIAQLDKVIVKQKKAKEKKNADIPKGSLFINSTPTTTLIDNSISRSAAEELVKNVGDKVDEMKSTINNRKAKYKFRGGY